MELESFKAGHWRQRIQYKSFEPTPINQEWTWKDPIINALLESANHALGQLDAFSLIVPDVDRFLHMHILKEAQTSSRIEGTQTGMDEVLLKEEYVRPERRDDRREVLNYIEAINTAIQRLTVLPLSNRLLKETHKILLQGVRGEHKQPGEFRTSQNWIGGSNLNNAAFIPPHQENVPELMGDLESFWHNDTITVPHLVRIALTHYQFETIHPFLDDNGRIGRLLIPLYLVDKKLLSKPSLYLSAFFEQNRAAYYDALTRVRMNNDLNHWIRFFLTGIVDTATKGRNIFKNILELRERTDEQIFSLGKRMANAKLALQYLYQNPIVNASVLESELGFSHSTAHILIKELVRIGILAEMTGQQRGRIFIFSKYFNMFVD